MTLTGAGRRCLAVTSVFLIAGLASGRVALILLALPFAVGAALALPQRDPGAVQLEISPDRGRVDEGDTVALAVSVTTVDDADAVVVTVHADGLALAGEAGTHVTATRAGERRVATVSLRAPVWGRQRAGPVVSHAVGHGLLLRGAGASASQLIEVLPAVGDFVATPSAPRARAYSGLHRSRQIGEGLEFAKVRPMSPGDRPRRINWKASARTPLLQVNETHTDRTVSVVIVIDTLWDVGVRDSSTITVAVRAAAGVAAHYLRLGDAIALIEWGARQRFLPAGSGTAHWERCRSWLLDVRSSGSDVALPVRWPRLGGLAGSFTAVLSPLVDEQSLHLLASLRLRGDLPVAVDTFSRHQLPPARLPGERAAQELWLLERAESLERLADIGVPTVGWTGRSSLDTALDELRRLAQAPKASLRWG